MSANDILVYILGIITGIVILICIISICSGADFKSVIRNIFNLIMPSELNENKDEELKAKKINFISDRELHRIWSKNLDDICSKIKNDTLTSKEISMLIIENYQSIPDSTLTSHGEVIGSTRIDEFINRVFNALYLIDENQKLEIYNLLPDFLSTKLQSAVLTGYIGEELNGIPHGTGKFYGSDGRLIYSGEYKNGKWHGQGTWQSINFTGEFYNGKQIIPETNEE